MKQYAGIDVSLETSSVCVVDAEGRIIREGKVASEPEALIAWFAGLAAPMERIGLEAGPLSQWLHAAMAKAGLAVELLETRHVRAAFKGMPVKTDKKDARGIAQLMRLGWLGPRSPASLLRLPRREKPNTAHRPGLNPQTFVANTRVIHAPGCEWLEPRLEVAVVRRASSNTP